MSKPIGSDIQPSDLNDDALGATLDKIYHYGPTKLFNEIVLKIMNHEDLGSRLFHAHTTSFNIQGNTNGMTVKELKSIEITLGHSRNISKRLGTYLASPG